MTSNAGLDVPCIDLSAEEAVIAPAIASACQQWGFFQITGHGLAPELAEAAMASARRFFARPRTEKRALSRTADNPWGYYDRELTKNLRDKKEIFDIGPEGVLTTGADSLWSARTPWPADDPSFQSIMAAYVDASETLSRRLLCCICAGLGADPDRLDDAFLPASTSFLRLNYYPVADPMDDLPDEAAAGADLGIHHHTDAGALTVLMQDQVVGLQVWRDGAWSDVAPISGALVVNIGDMVQVWSNDLYVAPVHRVLAMDSVERMSLPFFYNPAYEATVAPLECCMDSGRPGRYRPIPWGEFRRRRAEGDFADYGSEVQISDYALQNIGG